MDYLKVLLPIGVSLVIGIIGFFLKRTIDDVDTLSEQVECVKDKAVNEAEFEKAIDECRSDIKKIRVDYTPREMHSKDFDEVRADIKSIKEDYITKEDFFREQGKTDRKLDRIMDILLEMKGDHAGGK